MPYVLKTPDSSTQEVVLPGGKLGRLGQGVLAIDYLSQFLAEFQSLGTPLTGAALLAAASNFVNARGGLELANVSQSRIDNYYQELGYPVGFGAAPTAGGSSTGDVFDPAEIKRGTQQVYQNQGGVRSLLVGGSIPDFMEVGGHSYPAGGGAPLPGTTTATTAEPDLAYPMRLARAVGIQRVRNISTGGAIACWPTLFAGGDGGWAHVWQETFRAPPSIDQPLYPQAPVVLLHYGINDLAQLGSQSLKPFKEAYRSIIASHKLAARYMDADASCVYTGTWGTFTSTTHNSGWQFRYTTTDTDRVTITVPARYDGQGSVDLFVIGQDAVTLGITVDGVAQSDWVIAAGDWDTSSGAKTNGMVKRLGALAAGTHTIVVTKKSGGTFNFDSWGIEAADGPLFLVPMPNRCYTYGLWTSFAHGPAAGADPMTDASIPYLKTAMQQVHAEFDATQIVEVDIDTPLAKAAANFALDQCHPNLIGHRLIADAARNALLAHSFAIPVKLGAPPRLYWRRVGGPGGPAYNGAWVQGNNPLVFAKDEGGIVRMHGSLKNPTAANYTAQVMFVLPPGFRPLEDKLFIVSMGALWGTLWVVASNGQVLLLIATGASNNAGVTLDPVNFEAQG